MYLWKQLKLVIKMEDELNEFFLVWNWRTGYTRNQKHSRSEALRECKRLSRANPGDRFYVLKALEFVEVEPKPLRHEVLVNAQTGEPAWKGVEEPSIQSLSRKLY